MPNRQKIKGSRFEREIRAALRERGLHVRKVPSSGAGADFKGDLHITVGGIVWQGECKSRGRCFGTIYGMKGNSDVLFVKDDYCPPLVVMDVPHFIALVLELNDYKDLYQEERHHAMAMEQEREGQGKTENPMGGGE